MKLQNLILTAPQNFVLRNKTKNKSENLEPIGSSLFDIDSLLDILLDQSKEIGKTVSRKYGSKNIIEKNIDSLEIFKKKTEFRIQFHKILV